MLQDLKPKIWKKELEEKTKELKAWLLTNEAWCFKKIWMKSLEGAVDEGNEENAEGGFGYRCQQVAWRKQPEAATLLLKLFLLKFKNLVTPARAIRRRKRNSEPGRNSGRSRESKKLARSPLTLKRPMTSSLTKKPGFAGWWTDEQADNGGAGARNHSCSGNQAVEGIITCMQVVVVLARDSIAGKFGGVK